MSCVCDYVQNGVQEWLREVLFRPQLVDLGLHAALTKKRKMFESSADFWCAVRLCMPYTFRVMREGKEQRKKKKKERKKGEEEEEHNRNFRVRFSRL